ncbi:MAG TPA: ABC transporter permease [Xanthobacteraceae bacterium]|jgi:ABC-type nitrate/sulfonate/bicarbonate transport system permease component
MNRFIRIAARPEPAGAARRGIAALSALLLYAYPLLLVLAAWELAGWANLVRPLFLPRVISVVRQFWVLLGEGEIVDPLVVSLYRTFCGLALAVVAGIIAGLLMTRSKWANWLLDPLISVGFPAPKIAFVPIFTLWFGIDHVSKILLVAFNCVFPMIVATYHGAASVSRILIWSAEAMGTSKRALLYRIVLPAALPHILSGVRVTVPVALIITFTTEMIAGGGGVGAALMFAQRFFQTPTVFVYIMVMLVTGLIFDRAMLVLRRRLIPWQDEREEE